MPCHTPLPYRCPKGSTSCRRLGVKPVASFKESEGWREGVGDALAPHPHECPKRNTPHRRPKGRGAAWLLALEMGGRGGIIPRIAPLPISKGGVRFLELPPSHLLGNWRGDFNNQITLESCLREILWIKLSFSSKCRGGLF